MVSFLTSSVETHEVRRLESQVSSPEQIVAPEPGARPMLSAATTPEATVRQLLPAPATAPTRTRPTPETRPAPPLEPPVERRRRRRRHRHNRHLRDALSRPQRLSLLCFALAWMLLSAAAWSWWLKPANVGTPVGYWLNTSLLFVESLLLPSWFFSWLWRMRRPDPSLAVPDLRVAMVVTKAPSEPWAVVRETLEAMLSQDFPYGYDVWLADESPSEVTYHWCAQHGVRVSTREGVAEYHQATWPRRTKCKEGNLAYFYDHWGYESYDVVAQMDADHVPEPDYLRHMVIPFRDPLVGYVAAPSICDRNAERSWSARARLYAEAVLHGPMQAGHSGGCAPSCIGSHYAVRTAALQQIGGLGPELAEDFTTTVMMSSYSWQGVFAIEAHAHGDGPENVGDCMTQEFQWSRSMMNVLLGVNQRYWRGLSRMAKLRLGFCQIWYPLFAALMVASIAVPVVAIATRTPPVRVSLGSFYLHFGPPTLVLLAVVLWLRSLRWLRPMNAKAFSWEIALFQLVRWPWVLWGCLQAVAGRIAGREFDFKVTPKGRTGPQPLPTRVVAPYLAIALVAASPSILHLSAGPAHGYYTLTLINVGLYLTAALAVVLLHAFDHPRGTRSAVLRRSVAKLGAAGALSLAIVAAIVLPGTGIWPSPSPAAPPAPTIAATVVPPIEIGVTTPALADNEVSAWAPSQLAEVNRFERLIGAHTSIVMWYADWAHNGVSLSQLNAVSRRGSIPEITWEPWDDSLGLRKAQPKYSLLSIIQGRHDAYIRQWARELRAYGKPVLLRFAQEMNGDWYPWSERLGTNRPGQFVAAWRHVHDVFAAAGATNVRWVWSPVARYGVRLSTDQYPGRAYVDILGLSGFNGGSALHWTGWRSFSAVFDKSLATLKALAPDVPVQISEVSSAEAGGSKGAWISAMFRDLHADPQVRAVIWFDVAKQTEWQIDSSRQSAASFAAALRWLEDLAGRATVDSHIH
ncbi:MAG TPA: glycosyl hydrolase [Solirubrobacteraceae bacterium]|nr:glycosyl hydrolase [Solirubrobacteraceae bacterium]